MTDSPPLYTVTVCRDFIANHYLVGGDWGAENQQHAHLYRVEVRLSGTNLDRHGYLIDIDEISAALDARIQIYRDRTLNELPDFSGINPSLEHFARILCQALAADIDRSRLCRMGVRLWENDSAWAEYRLDW